DYYCLIWHDNGYVLF
nr:immunoglobulin light chain junction region [Macaca mulatta]MOW71696.1 immunoglobulin light chain junction region [Macaca mulatta]